MTNSDLTTISQQFFRRALLLIPLALAFFALLPTAQAVLPSPTPDGAYPNANTAEGNSALFSLTTGAFNTAIGFDALQSNTTGNSNTATGDLALRSNTTGHLNTATGSSSLATQPGLSTQPPVSLRCCPTQAAPITRPMVM